MGVQQRAAKIGVAKQSAKGTAASAATYNFGVSGGSVFKTDITEDELALAWSGRIVDGFDRMTVIPGAEFETYAFPKMVGLFLLLAMGSDSVSGSGTFTHVFSTSDDLPYATVFAQLGATGQASLFFEKLVDAKLNELEISWDRTGSVKLKASFIGCDSVILDVAPTWGAVERPVDGTFRGANGASSGTFTVDGAASIVKTGSIKITNNLSTPQGSATVGPADVFPGMHSVEVSLTVIPDNLLTFRKILTGSTVATAAANVPYYAGTTTLKHVVDANTDLTFDFARLKLASDFPDADPSGGPVEVAIEGVISLASSGNSYTATLRNTIATY